MIKIIGEIKSPINFKCSYTPEVNTFNIECDIMNDKNIISSMRVSKNCMVWILENNILGEIEVINPKVLNDLNIEESKSVSSSRLMPLIQSSSRLNTETSVVLFEKRFLISLSNEKKFDKKFINNNVIFYTLLNEVVLIEAINYQIIE